MTAALSLVALVAHAILLAAAAPLVAATIRWCGQGCIGRLDHACAAEFRQFARLARKREPSIDTASAIGRHAAAAAFAAIALAALATPGFAVGTAIAPLSDAWTALGMAAAGRAALALGAMDRGAARLDADAARRAWVDASVWTVALGAAAAMGAPLGGLSLDAIATARIEPELAPGAARGLAACAVAALAVADMSGRRGAEAAFAGADLALIRVAEALRMLFWCDLGIALAFPAGIADAAAIGTWPAGIAVWIGKLGAIAAAVGIARLAFGELPTRWAARGVAVAAACAALAALLSFAGAAQG